MKAEYAIRKVIINSKKREVTICDNGMDIPEQTISFEDEDYWNCVNDRKGVAVLDMNIWWDERWGFYVGLKSQKDEVTGETYLTNDGDYRNPDIIEFVDGDNNPLYTQVAVDEPNPVDVYEWRAVLKQAEGGDNIESIPMVFVNVAEQHEVESIGLYKNNPDGTQTHIIDISHSEIKQWHGLFVK